MKTNSCDASGTVEPSNNLSPFEQFDAFARRIMSVPKKEIDEKEAEWKARQTTKKTKQAPKPK